MADHTCKRFVNAMRPVRAAILLCCVLFSFFAEAQPNRTDDKGRKQGEWMQLHEGTDIPAYRTEFKDDRPVGTTERYYKDGSLQARIDHGKSGTDRAEIFYPEKGGLMANGNYVNRERDSTWRFFDAEGNLKAEETYRKGVKHGISRIYFEDGSLSEKVTYAEGVKHGEWEQYYPNGNLKLKATVREGVSYEGEFTNFHPNGKPMLKGKYTDGKRESSWYTYKESGAVEVIHVYREGKVVSEHPQNGEFEKYYPDDIKRSMHTYKNGKKHGPFREYYRQGEWRTEEAVDEFGNARPVQRLYGTQVMREGRYYEDELHGEVITYTEKGRVKKREHYEKGQKIK